MKNYKTKKRNGRTSLELALIFPILLLISISIFDIIIVLYQVSDYRSKFETIAKKMSYNLINTSYSRKEKVFSKYTESKDYTDIELEKTFVKEVYLNIEKEKFIGELKGTLNKSTFKNIKIKNINISNNEIMRTITIELNAKASSITAKLLDFTNLFNFSIKKTLSYKTPFVLMREKKAIKTFKEKIGIEELFSKIKENINESTK